MLLAHRDVPLDKDPSARFLPWLIAFMVYLAALALAGAIAVSNLTERWDRGLSDQMTVQVPPPRGEENAMLQSERVAAALETLRGERGVRTAEVVDDAEMAALLEPWLGEAGIREDLPLPALIAVEVVPGNPPDSERLEGMLQAAAPGVVVEDHQRTLGRFLAVTQSLQLLALLVVGLVAGAAVLSVVFVTRTGLAVHRQVIELLHLIGARDNYIAGQFQRQALKLGLAGGLIGVGLAGGTILVLGQVFATSESVVVPELALSLRQWLLLVLVPPATALVAMATARWTVLRTLARLS